MPAVYDELSPPTPADLGLQNFSIGTAGTNTVMRLREGLERMYITDINNAGASALSQSFVPIMWDTIGSNEFGDSGDATAVFNHIPGGSNVLYMDGHVNFVRYGDEFPMSNLSDFVKENSHYGLG